jgi:hypothetical protein
MYINGQEIRTKEIKEKPDITENQPLRVGANSLDLDILREKLMKNWNRGLTVKK